MPRRGGFVFPQRSANLGKREVLGIVTGESQTIARLESRGCGPQRMPHRLSKSRPLGHRSDLHWHSARFVVCGQRLQPSRASKTIDVALGKHRAKPGAKAAAPVKVAEQRSTLPVPLGKPEQLGVQAIRGFARRAGFIDRVCRSIKQRALFADEMFPGRIVSVRARGGQGEILEMQSAQVAFDVRSLGALRKCV